jgi:hypothetical protein
LTFGAVVLVVTLAAVTNLGNLFGTTETLYKGAISPVTLNVKLQDQIASAKAQRYLPSVVTSISGLGNDFPDWWYNKGCFVKFGNNSPLGGRPSTCYWGDKTAKKTIVLFGDSNAYMWMEMLHRLGVREHYRVELLARAGCEVANIPMWDDSIQGPGRNCTLFRQWALRHIQATHPFAVLVADYEYGTKRDYSATNIAPTTYTNALKDTIRVIKASRAKAIFIQTPPPIYQVPTTCLSVHSGNIQSCGVSTTCLVTNPPSGGSCRFPSGTDRTFTYERLDEYAVESAGGDFLSDRSWFCESGWCPPVINHMIVYRDQFHISASYANFLNRVFGYKLDGFGIPPQLSAN